MNESFTQNRVNSTLKNEYMSKQELITVIAGTNRPGSLTKAVAERYSAALRKKGANVAMLSLEELPADFAYTDLWVERSEVMSNIIETKLVPAVKYVFVIPEYNGGFPGVLKTFIDCVPPAVFRGKKASLVGISSGRAGALRPMDQFTNVLNYLKVNVLYSKLKFSNVETIFISGTFVDEENIRLLDEHTTLTIEF